MNPTYGNSNLINVNTNSSDSAVSDKNYLYSIARKTAIQAHFQAKPIVCSQSAELRPIVTRCNIVKRWCFLTRRDLVKRAPGKQIYVNTASLIAKPVGCLKLIIVASSSNPPTFLEHVRNNKPSTLDSRAQSTTQRDGNEDQHTNTNAYNKLQYLRGKPAHPHNPGKTLYKNSKTNRLKGHSMPE